MNDEPMGTTEMVSPRKRDKRVNISEIANGFTVNEQYGNTPVFAYKTLEEALEKVKELFAKEDDSV